MSEGVTQTMRRQGDGGHEPAPVARALTRPVLVRLLAKAMMTGVFKIERSTHLRFTKHAVEAVKELERLGIWSEPKD